MASVLQVTPALDAGGVERTTIEIAEALSRAGMGALVASRGGRLEGELAAAGGELIRLPLDTKNPLTIRANADRLAAIARERGVSLIHARSRAPAWSAYWAAKRLALPFVTTYHGIYNGRTPWKIAYNGVMAKGDIVIANSHYTRDHVIRTHRVSPDRVIAIPRGVDLERFDPGRIAPGAAETMRRQWGLAPSPGLVLLLAARLTRWKGQMLLIEAAARVLETRRGAISIVLAGDDQGRARYKLELVEAIRRAGLGNRAVIAGHIADMPAALAAADVAVAPSLEPEAFGRSAAEAAAMGLPVIAADHGGLAETTIHGETGLLTPPGDAPALAAAIESLLDMGPGARRAMGARGQARARSLYAKAALQEATLGVYRRLIGAKA